MFCCGSKISKFLSWFVFLAWLDNELALGPRAVSEKWTTGHVKQLYFAYPFSEILVGTKVDAIIEEERQDVTAPIFLTPGNTAVRKVSKQIFLLLVTTPVLKWCFNRFCFCLK